MVSLALQRSLSAAKGIVAYLEHQCVCQRDTPALAIYGGRHLPVQHPLRGRANAGAVAPPLGLRSGAFGNGATAAAPVAHRVFHHRPPVQRQ